MFVRFRSGRSITGIFRISLLHLAKLLVPSFRSSYASGATTIYFLVAGTSVDEFVNGTCALTKVTDGGLGISSVKRPLPNVFVNMNNSGS